MNISNGHREFTNSYNTLSDFTAFAACDSNSTDGKFDWRNGMRLDLTVNSIRYSHIFERKSQWYCNTMTIKEVSLELSVDAFGKS